MNGEVAVDDKEEKVRRPEELQRMIDQVPGFKGFFLFLWNFMKFSEPIIFLFIIIIRLFDLSIFGEILESKNCLDHKWYLLFYNIISHFL